MEKAEGVGESIHELSLDLRFKFPVALGLSAGELNDFAIEFESYS